VNILDNIQRIRAGDLQAPKQLYVHTYKQLFALAKRYVSCDELSKDVLQNTYLKIFKNLSRTSFRYEGEAYAWMRKICVNESLTLIRTKKNWDKLQFTSKDQIVANNNDLYSEEIYNHILKMPTKQRTVFNLIAIEGYSHKEVAAQLSITETNSRTLLGRARKYLSTKLSKELRHESA